MKAGITFEEIMLAEGPKEEEKLLREFVIAHPTDTVACLRLGKLLRERGDYTGALKLHKSLLAQPKLHPKIKKKIYKNVVEDYVRAGNSELALSFAKKLQKLDERDPVSMDFLSSFYQDLSRWQEAVQLKQYTLRLRRESDDTGLAILYAFWGNSLVQKSNEKEGLKHLKEALRLNKFCLPALIFMGDFYYDEGEIDKGIEFWKKVIVDIPDYSFVVFDRLEKAFYAKHDFSHVEELYASFLQEHPEDTKILIKLSGIYEKRGEDTEAIDVLEKAREIAPEDIKIKKRLSKLYRDNERFEDMFQSCLSIVESGGIPKDFKCSNCGSQFDEFMFRCSNCKHWLTIR